jgi:hypothetical protein
MAISPETLAQLATEYADSMTSIRGRRIVRLIKREFGGADQVMIVSDRAGRPGVLGVSQAGAALCTSDGKGPSAAIYSWLYGAAEATETRYDLLKDSLPVVSSARVGINLP